VNLEIYNAEEVIKVDEVSYKKDSVFIKTPVFQGYIAAKIEDNGDLKGQFIKSDLDRVVPFEAQFNVTERFESSKAEQDVTGVWETVFSEGIAEEEYMAKGIFKQEGSRVTGTFRTTTGDYRFLEGVMDGNLMRISAFDGAHAFLFVAEVTDSTMSGQFYSGNHWKEPFKAKRNPEFELPSADSLTYLKEGYESLKFAFPNAKGELVSIDDEAFKDKVIVVQIMGTWCPNCLDESKYYTEFYNSLKNEDFEIIALAFEYAKTEERAFKNIKRLKDRLGIPYPILLAQYGSSSKTEANDKLPMLNQVLSYPTSIFIDKQGKVRKIHTGFNGPATGEKFVEFKTDFESFVQALLSE
jgi:thiol-disulfide isomerase/thioredoxin